MNVPDVLGFNSPTLQPQGMIVLSLPCDPSRALQYPLGFQTPFPPHPPPCRFSEARVTRFSSLCFKFHPSHGRFAIVILPGLSSH